MGTAVSGKCLVSHAPTRADSTSSGYEAKEVRSREKRLEDYEAHADRRKNRKKKRAKKKAGKKASKKTG